MSSPIALGVYWYTPVPLVTFTVSDPRAELTVTWPSRGLPLASVNLTVTWTVLFMVTSPGTETSTLVATPALAITLDSSLRDTASLPTLPLATK